MIWNFLSDGQVWSSEVAY